MKPISLDFTGALAETIGPEHGLTEAEILKAAGGVRFPIDYPFMRLAEDTKLVAQANRAAEAVRCKFQNLVVLGIGGSALGLKCLAQSCLKPYYNLLESKSRGGNPRLFVCDNIDPDHFGELVRMLDWKETCINVISKSGRTTETLSQFYIIKELLLKRLSIRTWQDHVFVTTDEKEGPLRTMATQEKLQGFVVPRDVGGRFSVLSSVGLFPAACVGINIKELLDGAAAMNARCQNDDVFSNPAVANAAIHYLMDAKKGKRISVMMPYSDSLALFSDWYAQLWAESLGKKGNGPTPVKAVGATDQHSQLQLYMDGPADKVVTIVGVEKFRAQLNVPKNVGEDFEYIGGKDMGAILRAEETATAQALVKSKRPVVRLTLPDISAGTMGQLFMLYQIQTAVAGSLYGINPFDQPGVELGKRLTKELLSA